MNVSSFIHPLLLSTLASMFDHILITSEAIALILHQYMSKYCDYIYHELVGRWGRAGGLGRAIAVHIKTILSSRRAVGSV